MSANQASSPAAFLLFAAQTVRPLVYDTIRREVDEEMKVVLQNLKDMLLAERAGKGGKKGAKSKKGKKGKKGKKVGDSTNKACTKLIDELSQIAGVLET